MQSDPPALPLLLHSQVIQMGRLLWCLHSRQILHPDDLLVSLEESLSCRTECSQWQTIRNRWQHDPVKKKNKQTNNYILNNKLKRILFRSVAIELN